MTCFPYWRVVRERKRKVRGVIMKREREREKRLEGRKSKVCG
jgi:hypothetical protein